jgi:hypothetical protein
MISTVGSENYEILPPEDGPEGPKHVAARQ